MNRHSRKNEGGRRVTTRWEETDDKREEGELVERVLSPVREER